MSVRVSITASAISAIVRPSSRSVNTNVDDVEAEQAEQRGEHEDPVARRAERRHHPGDERRQRVRRRRAEHVVVGQLAVGELLAPDERVVGVVVGIRLPDHEDGDDDERAEREQPVGQPVVPGCCRARRRRAVASGRGMRSRGTGHGHARSRWISTTGPGRS